MKTYNVRFKLKVIKLAEEKGKHHAAKLFKVDRKRVREWVQNKEKLMALPKNKNRLRGAGRPLKYKDIDVGLMRWLSDRRQAGIRVTGKALKHEALLRHRENGCQSFKASYGWFTKFKRRHNLSFRRSTHIAQHPKEITDDRIDSFLKYVINIRKNREYGDQDIANMDETPVWFDMPGKSTLNATGEREIMVSSTGHEKQKITVTLGAYAEGTKISPLVHLPGVRPLPKTDIPTGVVVYMCGTGQKSWADETSIKFWLSKLWGRNNQRRRILVWDAFRAHLTPGVKRSVNTTYNTDMCVIPGGCTSKLQPADVPWNRPFKIKLQELYDQWLFDGPAEYTAHGNRQSPSKALMLQWIKEAWGSITPDIVRKSFKKCGINSALDGSEDHIFQAEDDNEEAPDTGPDDYTDDD